MIQRIQSVYLAIVVLLSIALFYVPFFTLEVLKDAGNMATGEVQHDGVLSNTVFIALNSVAGLFAFATILLYKNRRLQIRLSNLNVLLICIFTGTIFYFSNQTVVHYDLGCYFPLIQLVLTVLAIRAIKKDEELVRSADRLR